MKKLLIPLLLVLKLFKLKLLLFLPLILGLASFKKLIGVLIFAVPAIIGILKITKPDLSHNYGSFGHSSYYNLPPHRRRYQVASVSRHPARLPPLERDTDIYQSPGTSYQSPPYAQDDSNDDRHHLAYNSYHGYVNK